MVGDEPVSESRPLGPLIQTFFVDHLVTVKGLRPTSVRSYRDTIRLLLSFVARDNKTRITKLTVEDLTFERVVGFLRYLEDERRNHVRTRNQRLAALHTLFDYVAAREPEMLGVCQRVAAIPSAAFRNSPWKARPDAAAVPLQHRSPRARGRRPSSR